MEKFANSVCIVTGASAGIGKELCKILLDEGQNLKVIGLARREIEIAHENFHGMICDVSKANQISDTVEKIRKLFPDRKISILVNNAGHAKPLPLMLDEKLNDDGTNMTTSLQEASDLYTAMLGTNVLGLTLMTREVHL
jgi:3-oxoacyl-[acyl-carrier protein] reductase